MKQNDQSSFIGLILIAGIFILGNLFLFNNTEESQVASNSDEESKNIEINNEVNDSEDSSPQREEGNDKKDINGDITIEEETFVLENDKILLKIVFFVDTVAGPVLEQLFHRFWLILEPF